MTSSLPPCLMLDTTMPPANIVDLSRIVTLIRPDEATDPAVLASIRVAVCSPIQGFDSIWFNRLPCLKMISVFGVGLDKIDVEAARTRGIAITITRDILTQDTADMAFALLLGLTRQIVSGDAMIREGRWAAGERLAHGVSLRNKKLGIVGLGAVGHEIARKASIFGMKPSYYNRHRKQDVAWDFYDNVQDLAASSDILAIAIAATTQTNKIISAAVLNALGKNGIIINIARGAVIDEEALITALKDKTIAGAGLDVFCNEPKINPAFLGLPNVVLAPHQGSATVETRHAMAQCVVDNVRNFLECGYPLTAIA